MTYTPIPFRSFAGGLNLRDAPDVVNESEAIDLLNVTFSERGALEQRDGYAKFTALDLTDTPDSLFPFQASGGSRVLLVGNGDRVDSVDTGGLVEASLTGQTASPHFFARFGGPTREAVYIANGTDQVKRYSAGAFSTPAGLAAQTGMFLTVSPTSNRLIVARESGTTAGNNQSSVNFSDPGDPETFTSTNFLDLDPGDGEAIMGACTFGDLVFIFKETKFWVHYGESTDSVGEPVFNVRKIDTGVGLAASKALAVGRDGVYFLGRDGVYRTAGQGVELLSDKIEPFFLGGASPFFRSEVLDQQTIGSCAATYYQDRFYLAVPSTFSATNDRMLVFDPKHGWWTLWDIPAAALCVYRPSSRPELFFAGPTTSHVYRHSSNYINDGVNADGTAGTPVSARWRSGWIDYQTHDVKTIRETILTGTGELDLTLTKDFENAAGQTEHVSLTGSPDLWQGTSYETWGDGTDPTDLWGDGSDPTELWGNGLPSSDSEDVWGDGTNNDDLWGDGSDPGDLWGDGTFTDAAEGEEAWGDGSDDDLWGPSSEIATEKARVGIRGRVFSTQISNSESTVNFTVHRLVHHLRERRVPSVVGTER